MSSSTSSPVVSVTICLHDSSAWIDETLESVLAQTYPHFEVVVVDDGSRDGCAERVEERHRDDRIRVIRQPHRGLGQARATSLAQARGEYVAFLDHDDLWLPDKLERQVRAARDQPEIGLVFSDCLLIDVRGEALGRLSHRFDMDGLDLSGTRGFYELLRRGCFIDLSTVLARAEALREAGGFDPRYVYVEDYDLWLRVARAHRLCYLAQPLAKRRVHDAQFTRAHPRVALAEQLSLLRPFMANRTYPPEVRRLLGDYLLGQHRQCRARLREQGRRIATALTALRMVRLPRALLASWWCELSRTPAGPFAQRLLESARWTAPRIVRLLRGWPAVPSPNAAPSHVWVDGSPLAEPRTGYFNLVVELVRALVRSGGPSRVVHVVAPDAGVAALRERLGSDAARLRLHRMTWSFPHWTTIYSWLGHWRVGVLLALAAGALALLGVAWPSRALLALGALTGAAAALQLLDEMAVLVKADLNQPRRPLLARLVRRIWQTAGRPWRRGQGARTVEVLVWRGRFRFAGSRKYALVQDLTTRIHPELHTPGNVAEFEDYLQYALRHADLIATVSESSRRDIVSRLDVFPGSVAVMPVPVNPVYLQPSYDPALPRGHGLTGRYLLHVGTAEPRKNLRRLVRAFEWLLHCPEACGLTLALAGPAGWDEGFERFLVESDAYRRVQRLGFVPLSHLPSLYHYASAVVCASVYEGFGLPVLEALCCSAVVATSRTSSLPAIVGEGAITFDPYSTREMTDALLAALRLAPAEAARHRRRARARAETWLGEAQGRPALPGLGAD